MDAQTLRRLLWDFIKFNPKDFTVQGSLTGFNVSARPARTAEPDCILGLYNRSDSPGEYKIGVRWGKINGRQPSGFNSRGKIDALSIVTTPSYIYAEATLNPVTLLWTSTRVIVDISPFKQNTAILGYELLGVVEIENERIKSPIVCSCGHVVINICDLALE